MPIPIEDRGREQWRELLAELNPSVEILHLIRELRRIGMEKEVERVETQLHESRLAGGVITAARETN